MLKSSKLLSYMLTLSGTLFADRIKEG